VRVKPFTGIAIAALLTGCDTSHSSAQRDARVSTPRPAIVVTHDDASLPRRCGVRRTASRVVDFLDAVNRGDAEALDGLIADREHFQWYSSNEGDRQRSRTFSATGLTSAVDSCERPTAPWRRTARTPALPRGPEQAG
jgi:hypothetical protein